MQAIGEALNLGRYAQLRALLEALPADDPDRICCGLDGCDGYGHVVREIDGRLVSRKCPNILQASLQDSVEDRMVGRWEDWPPPTFAEFRSAAGFVETPSFLAVEKLFYAANQHEKPHGVILCGGHGRGKTLSPLILIREGTAAGIKCHAIKFPELIGYYKKGFEGQYFVERELRIIEGSSVVYVDEIGREPGGNPAHAQSAISDIVARCYRRKFLILCSNMNKKELAEFLPSDVCSRLHKKAGYCSTTEEPVDKDLRQQSLI